LPDVPPDPATPPDPSPATLLSQFPLSANDRAIIAHLQEDGRRPFVTIADDVGLSEKTVRNRVHQLLDANVIQIVALTSPEALGYRAGALAGLTIDPAVPATVIARDLRKIADVDYVVVAAGRFSIMVEIISADLARIQKVIEEEIGRIHGIRSIELFPYFSVYYQKARFFGRPGEKPEREADQAGVKRTELEAIDKQIVLELCDDGRQPLKKIADRLEISETQVRTRIAAMTQAGRMRIMAIVNPMNLENRAIAWLGIKAAPQVSTHRLADLLVGLPNISYIALCGGRFDMFAEIVCPSPMDLLATVDTQIRPLAEVGSVEIFVYIDLHYKRLVPLRG
jgi:DNA-binding Lrp family transcriptional regulator